MYTFYFGFKENPFSLTPDPNYLYLSSHHKEAFDHLLYGINERKGFIVVTGGIGTGKTTLCRALLGTLDSSTKTALILNAYISDTELLKTINQEFGIRTDTPGQSKKDYIDSLNQFLLETFSQGGNAVLLIDEAQNLSHTVLEQIRMLSNLETEKEKLIQIVLVGQSELKEVLTSPSLRQLNERIMVRYDLKPLDKKDVRGYVEHRLVVAGGRGNLQFTKGAFEAIYAYSQGNPRRINGVCDRALLIAYSRDEFTISRKTVQKAIDDIRSDVRIELRPRRSQKMATTLSVLLLLLLIIVAALGGWNFRKEISALISSYVTATPIQTTQGIPNERKIAVVVTKKVPHPPPQPKMKAASLFLDEQASLAGLFGLFNAKEGKNNHVANEVHLGLFSFHAEPEYYIIFRKPFRVRMAIPAHSPDTGRSGALPSPRYLLICKATDDGAIAIDADGKEQIITRDFILSHWDREVSWVYPYEDKGINLIQGMKGPDIVKLQKALNEIGYPVEPTGLYDKPTFNQVVKFQDNFELKTDGIVGTRTKGLLYQMSE
ncbi:MAG: AAA family ATPase [Desulfobacterales bacterium]|nr:AAA family ATPase [Desulfobacterales bacterium]